MVRRLVDGRLEVVVLPNPLAPEFVAEEGLDAPPAASPVLLWIGRLDEHKDWRAFLEIGRSVAERVGRVELWMIGGSVGAAGVGELEREARRAGVLGRLRWLPRLSQLGVRASIDLARASPGVMIATSRAESFGMTVAEAMARRCPVVVPDAGPFSEYVEDGVTGMLYRPGSRADAAERAALLLRDTMLHRRLGSESRRAVLERYATDVAIDSLVALLRTIGTVGGPAVPSPAGAAGTIVVPRASAP
jgi:glycosyltransferase involved in cell wall biosynthesis